MVIIVCMGPLDAGEPLRHTPQRCPDGGMGLLLPFRGFLWGFLTEKSAVIANPPNPHTRVFAAISPKKACVPKPLYLFLLFQVLVYAAFVCVLCWCFQKFGTPTLTDCPKLNAPTAAAARPVPPPAAASKPSKPAADDTETSPGLERP